MKRLSMTVTALLVTAVTFSAAADEVTYRKHIRPLFQQQCASCHGADAPYLGDFKESKPKFVAKDMGPRMDTYADLIFFIGWPDTGAIMRRLDDVAGSGHRPKARNSAGGSNRNQGGNRQDEAEVLSESCGQGCCVFLSIKRSRFTSPFAETISDGSFAFCGSDICVCGLHAQPVPGRQQAGQAGSLVGGVGDTIVRRCLCP